MGKGTYDGYPGPTVDLLDLGTRVICLSLTFLINRTKDVTGLLLWKLAPTGPITA